MNSTALRFSLALSMTAFLAVPSIVQAGRPAAQVAAEAEAEAAKEEPLPKDAPPAPPYVLKNKSEFNTTPSDGARVPFWPIGWSKGKPVTVATTTAAPTAKLTEAAFRLTSILLSTGTTPSLAVINGRPYSEGELLRFPRGSQPLKIRVARINDGSVILESSDEKLTVPLRRPELNHHEDNDPLLDPNR